MEACRCGHTTAEQHPCHGDGYACKKDSKQRFYNPHIASLAGAQLKFEVKDTWACDDCWEKFTKRLKGNE
jgi:hypothetical protein